MDLLYANGLMVPHIQEIGKIARKKAKGHCSFPMGLYIRANLEMTNQMVMAPKYSPMVANILESSSLECSMDKANLNRQLMELSMKELGNRIK